jgi:hypothetical protein
VEYAALSLSVEPTERSAKDFAIEFGGYLADSAEAFMAALNEYDVNPEADGAADVRGDCWKGLASAVYEFRKRADRAKLESRSAPEKQQDVNALMNKIEMHICVSIPKSQSELCGRVIESVRTAYKNWAESPALEEQPLTDEQIKHMVNRFLTWRLPENFNPDGGINFKPTFNEHTDHPMRHEPVGTNLFDATQAEEMVRYMVDGLSSVKAESSSSTPKTSSPEGKKA